MGERTFPGPPVLLAGSGDFDCSVVAAVVDTLVGSGVLVDDASGTVGVPAFLGGTSGVFLPDLLSRLLLPFLSFPLLRGALSLSEGVPPLSLGVDGGAGLAVPEGGGGVAALDLFTK